jgi:hypothetical protein
MQLLFKCAVAHLLQDFGISRFVDLECLAAVRTDDFVHFSSLPLPSESGFDDRDVLVVPAGILRRAGLFLMPTRTFFVRAAIRLKEKLDADWSWMLSPRVGGISVVEERRNTLIC